MGFLLTSSTPSFLHITPERQLRLYSAMYFLDLDDLVDLKLYPQLKQHIILLCCQIKQLGHFLISLILNQSPLEMANFSRLGVPLNIKHKLSNYIGSTIMVLVFLPNANISAESRPNFLLIHISVTLPKAAATLRAQLGLHLRLRLHLEQDNSINDKQSLQQRLLFKWLEKIILL